MLPSQTVATLKPTSRLQLVQLPEPTGRQSFAESVRLGLTAKRKTLPCRYFYDEEGSRLFERICDLPEYYLTRTEDSILAEYADEMIASGQVEPVMVELGSGSSTKTRRLIRAAIETYGHLCYVPIDISISILEESTQSLIADFDRLKIRGIVGTYHAALESLASKVERPKLFVFLGSSLGNFDAEEGVEFLETLARNMRKSDRLLLGTDLVKDKSELEAAYDDAEGVTAAFNKNLLVRINRELGGRFDLDTFDHKAIFQKDLQRVEMHLTSRVEQWVFIENLDLNVRFKAGETIHTENSHKYTADSLRAMASAAGLVEEKSWMDDEARFKVQRWKLMGD